MYKMITKKKKNNKKNLSLTLVPLYYYIYFLKETTFNLFAFIDLLFHILFAHFLSVLCVIKFSYTIDNLLISKIHCLFDFVRFLFRIY